jgi:hypothetical protein
MNDSMNKGRNSLPSSLREQLDGLRAKLRWVEGSKAAYIAFGLLLVSWLIVFGSDRLWDTPQPLLVLFSVTGWASAAWILRLGYRMAVEQPRHDENLAKIAQGRFPAIGDRLLGVIELCDPKKKTSKHSAALRKAAVAQVAEETARQDLCKAVDARILKRVAGGFAGLAAIAVLCSAFMPRATSNAWKRWSNPFNPVPRYTFAELTRFPTEKIVARGEPFQIHCAIDPDSFWLPEHATLTNEDGRELIATLSGTSYLFELEGLLEPISFTLRAGDASGRVEVTPLVRPSLRKVDAVIRYPDYLGYPTERREITGSAIISPIDSVVTVEGFANRSLRVAATIGNGNEQESLQATINGPQLTLKLGRIKENQTHQLVWRDEFGLSCGGPRKLEIIAKEDEPPTVDFSGLPFEVAVLETETLEVTTKARDDYGVRKLTLSWTLRNIGTEEEEQVAREWESDSHAVRSLEGTYPLNPTLLGAPAGSIIAIRAKVIDWRKGAEPVLSRELLAHVVSVETHAELIRARMEELLGKLSEIARSEEDILLETLKLENFDPEKASEESNQRETEATAEKQEDLAKQLGEMSEEGSENLREAMKNPIFDEKTLKEWSQTMQSMQGLAEGKMPEASKQLSQAASSSSPSERSENLSEAENTEREILEELQSLQGEINERLDELEALTLARRLREIKRTEDSLGESLTESLSETIGLRARDLPQKHKLLNENFHERQLETHVDTKTIKGEISRYHERTGKPQYGQVSEEMEETQAAEGLRSVAQDIQRNVSITATEKLGHWSVKFEEWAKMLEPDEGGGGGGEGGGEGKDITEQLIALLRVRKGEGDLRRHTILLEQEKKDVGKELKERSDELGGRQRELMVDLTDVQIELAEESLNPIFDDTHTVMADAAGKLENQDAGQDTVTSETKAFDLVSDLINLIVESQCQACNKPGASSQSQADAAAMQFLLQQYGKGEGKGMGMSSFGGGSNQGGDTDSNPILPKTNDGGTTPGDRRSRKASGWSGGLPSEFRDALEHYFREIEQ